MNARIRHAGRMESNGYRVDEMGGGCLAWWKSTEGGYVVISDEGNNLDSDEGAEVWSVGRYLDDGERYGFVVTDAVNTLEYALHLAAGIRLPKDGEECFE